MIRAHLAYFKTVTRHRWFVFLECCKLGVPFLGLIHDWTKYTPAEWGPYVRSFFNPDGSKRKVRDETGYYNPNKISQDFDYAWLNHQKNKHHWQYWVMVQDNSGLTTGDKILEMPSRYRREMLADWRGASRAYNGPGAREWYLKNQYKLRLHPETREWIEAQLEIP